MISALVEGILVEKPQVKEARNGSTFGTCRVKVVQQGGEPVYVRAITFSASAVAALVELEVGDAVSMAGELKAGVWVPKGGMPRPNLDLTVHRVQSAYDVKRKREAAQDAQGRRKAEQAGEYGDALDRGTEDVSVGMAGGSEHAPRHQAAPAKPDKTPPVPVDDFSDEIPF